VWLTGVPRASAITMLAKVAIVSFYRFKSGDPLWVSTA
jgi:hypothetical protein